MSGRRSRWTLWALAALSCAATAARAESGLVLPYPAVFETIDAATYDEAGERLGAAHLVIEKLDGGNVRILSESGIDDGARTVATAELAPIDGDRWLQLQVQESRSFDPSGMPLGVLRIDHRHGEATCTPPDGSGRSLERVDLPDADRIANVPFNLLFLPLVRGTADSVRFQLVLCRGGARTLDFEAHVVRREDGANGFSPLVEVRYGPEFGKMVSLIAQRLVPRLSFWFDPESSSPWLAHRVPLYAKGPEVLVVRDGTPARRLADEP